MTIASSATLLTIDDLLRLPDDGNLHELDEGRLVSMPPSAFKSGHVAALVSFFLTLFVREHDLGVVAGADAGVALRRDPDTIRAADVTFIRKERVVETGTGYYPGAPDLVGEVLSPSDRYAAVARKVSQYLAAGVRLVWVLDPYSRTAAVHRPGREVLALAEDGVLDGDDVVPGFALPLREIWV